MNGASFAYRRVAALVLLVLVHAIEHERAPNRVAAESGTILDSPEAQVEPERVERLVAKLGSSGFAEREAAERELLAIGKPAFDALQQAAAETKDLEVRDRAARLARAIGPEAIGELHRFEGHDDRIISVAFSSDGRQALSGGGQKPQPGGTWLPGTDFSVRLWDVATGEELQRFDGHSHAVMSVDLSPDGRHAVSGSMDKTVRLWDVESGKQLRVFMHDAAVRRVAFSSDGSRAITGNDDWTLRTGT